MPKGIHGPPVGNVVNRKRNIHIGNRRLCVCLWVDEGVQKDGRGIS